MNVHQWIQQQQSVVQSPLFAVSIATAKQAGTPLLLLLHWHGFRRATPLQLSEVKPAMHAIPGSAIQINEYWTHLEELDAAVLDAAWQLGAWDLNRTIHRACHEPAATAIEAEECRRSFGVYTAFDGDCPDQLLDDGAPDRDQLFDLAARTGYTRWTFRPVCGGLWADISEDVTLAPDGTRQGPCPVPPACGHVADRDLRRRQGLRTTYCLGKASETVLCPA